MGVVGVGGWGGSGHMRAYAESPLARVVAVCDAVLDRARQVAAQWHVPHALDDYRALLAMPEIDAVDVATPNDAHHEIVLAALGAGKHVLCEKPLALTVEHAREMERAAAELGRRGAVNFIHRYVPSARYVKELLDEGALGRVHHCQVTYAQGWLNDPAFPRVWRLNRAVSGTGVLGDLGSHAIDLARWWLGAEIAAVSGRLTTFTTRRPLPPTPNAAHSPADLARPDRAGTGTAALVEVDVDDEATWLASFEGGAEGHFFTSRNATARSNHIRAEIYGSDGAIVYDNGVRDAIQASLGRSMWHRNAWATLAVPTALMREDGKNAMHYAVEDVLFGTSIAPTFHDGVRAQEVMAAVVRSAAERRWVDVDLSPSSAHLAQPSRLSS
jgi:predicted dehydrogenase